MSWLRNEVYGVVREEILCPVCGHVKIVIDKWSTNGPLTGSCHACRNDFIIERIGDSVKGSMSDGFMISIEKRWSMRVLWKTGPEGWKRLIKTAQSHVDTDSINEEMKGKWASDMVEAALMDAGRRTV